MPFSRQGHVASRFCKDRGLERIFSTLRKLGDGRPRSLFFWAVLRILVSLVAGAWSFLSRHVRKQPNISVYHYQTARKRVTWVLLGKAIQVGK